MFSLKFQVPANAQHRATQFTFLASMHAQLVDLVHDSSHHETLLARTRLMLLRRWTELQSRRDNTHASSSMLLVRVPPTVRLIHDALSTPADSSVSSDSASHQITRLHQLLEEDAVMDGDSPSNVLSDLIELMGWSSVIHHAAMLVQLNAAFAHALPHDEVDDETKQVQKAFESRMLACAEQARWLQTEFIPAAFQTMLRLYQSSADQNKHKLLSSSFSSSNSASSSLALMTMAPSLRVSDQALSRSSLLASDFFRQQSEHLMNAWTYSLAASSLWTLIVWPYLSSLSSSASSSSSLSRMLSILGASALPSLSSSSSSLSLTQSASKLNLFIKLHLHLKSTLSDTVPQWIHQHPRPSSSFDLSFSVFEWMHRHLAVTALKSSHNYLDNKSEFASNGQSDLASSHPVMELMSLLRADLPLVR